MLEREQSALEDVRQFVWNMVKAGVYDQRSFKNWRDKNADLMEGLFWYNREPGMPSVTVLVKPFFHPTLPLIGINYTPVAHNVLYTFANGWTEPIRLCRGIVFDRKANLVAKPFRKFFNFGENQETKQLPDEPFEATVKHDGHLAIIFKYYNYEVMMTTRGSFVSKTAILGNQMLAKIAERKKWSKKFPDGLTLLAELIHPRTHVYLRYGLKRGFIIIGAYDNQTLGDFDYNGLLDLGHTLGLPVTDIWQGKSIADLRSLVSDLKVENQEGFVVRFKNGLRIKFKFQSYVNMMVADKLSYLYLMNRIVAGNLEKMIINLPEEIFGVAQVMLSKLRGVCTLPVNEGAARRQFLYNLVPEEDSTPYYKGVCGKFLRHLETNPNIPELTRA